VVSEFSIQVCEALDQFIVDVNAGKRPVLILEAPPQHGKTEIVSRKLPPFLMGRYPNIRLMAASYNRSLSDSISLDVRRNIADDAHRRVFPTTDSRRKYTVNRNGEFSSPYGKGSYISDGVGGGFTGKPCDIFIIDDPIKNHEEALSPTTKESLWNWYQSTSKTRMSNNSGLIIMATRWAQDDLSGRVIELIDLMTKPGQPSRLVRLNFPALNSPNETNYNASLPLGPLVPALHSEEQLLEFKHESSDYWWSALYQQSPKPIGGNVFKESGIVPYFPKDLPATFDTVVISWDCTFKDTDGTDFVVGQVWGKKGANSWLLDQRRARMSFTETCKQVIDLKARWPMAREILIEDKANGPAIIDTLKGLVPGIIPIEVPQGKLARAHSVTHVWEAGNIRTPALAIAPWMKPWISEVTTFPAAAHDDQVDSMTQALRHLYPLNGALRISEEALQRAMGLLK
jgi:predicted phage terminase large subunit-like protein